MTKLRPLPGDSVHFIGIGGVGMAALAELLLGLGYSITGSDLKESSTVLRLADLGAKVFVGHNAENISGAQTVVFSAAVPASNPEMTAAEASGALLISRAELLARVFNASRGLGVSGTHGKTTTSSMLAFGLERVGADPTWIIGGDLNDSGTGSRLGASDLVVAEADEAFGSFLVLQPYVSVVTNIDTDHLDHYGSQEAIFDAFQTYLSSTNSDGQIILCADDPGVSVVADRLDRPFVTYGTTVGSDWLATRNGEATVVTHGGSTVGELNLKLPGTHNIRNALAAIAAADAVGADPKAVLASLGEFNGVERRFSLRGETAGISVIDDYAHHPAEVAATLQAARERYPGRRVVALFQPHLYSRTFDLAGRFGGAFSAADLVVVTDIYAAREQPVPGVSGKLVWEAIRRDAPGVEAYYAPRLAEAAGITAGLARPGDVVLTLGAGDVTTAAGVILQHLETR